MRGEKAIEVMGREVKRQFQRRGGGCRLESRGDPKMGDQMKEEKRLDKIRHEEMR